MITDGRFLSLRMSSESDSLWRESNDDEKFSVSTEGHSSITRKPSLQNRKKKRIEIIKYMRKINIYSIK